MVETIILFIGHVEMGRTALLLQLLKEKTPLHIIVLEDIPPKRNKSNEVMLEEIVAKHKKPIPIPIIPYNEFIAKETEIFVIPNQNLNEGVTPLSQIEKIDSNKKHQESNLIFLGRPPTCLGLNVCFVQKKTKKPALKKGWSFIYIFSFSTYLRF